MLRRALDWYTSRAVLWLFVLAVAGGLGGLAAAIHGGGWPMQEAWSVWWPSAVGFVGGEALALLPCWWWTVLERRDGQACQRRKGAG